MRDTSTFQPNLLTLAQFSELQTVFDQVCPEFDFGLDDAEARDRVADTLVSVATTLLTTGRALRAARQTSRDIIKDRRT
jgi:hypothetical protein